jgi:transcriptional regulator with XRE-family HTH domain
MRRSNNPQPALGAAIRELRAKRGMTQEAVAQAAGITVAHLSGIERGHANPSWGAVVAIAEALDIPFSQLAKRYEVARDGGRH